MKKGFTLVELMVVIAVLGILCAIVTNVAVASIRNARGKRAEMMASALEQGITAYYAQMGEWPDVIENVAKDGDGDSDTHTFNAKETDEIFYQVVGRCFGKGGKKTVLLDPTALFVANKNKLGNSGNGCNDNHKNASDATYCGNKGCIHGVDFSTAVKKSGKNHIQLKDMAYGYQGKTEGRFRRFWVVYYKKTDSVRVSQEADGE